jgi:enoyl-CoA hydratase/carnithine racemase
VASPTATFGLPEALRGVFAAAGGPAKLVRNVGIPIASQIALTGKTISAQEALSYRLVNVVAPTPKSVMDEALKLAKSVAEISPDAAIVTRAALREAWETASVMRATDMVLERFYPALTAGENAREGLVAFAEKRKPNWVPSKL